MARANKVALTTWWHYHNYGTILQATAMYNVLKSLGHHVDVVNYIPHGKRYPVSQSKETPATDWGTAERMVDAEREERFDDFISRSLSFTSSCKTEDDFQALNSDYGAFVTGSDQIWSPVVFDSRYYLDYVRDNRKKISYAPSMGVSSVENSYVREQMTNLISQFAHLAAREQKGADIIQELTSKVAQTVLDPTLLLTYSEWRTIMASSKPSKAKGKYILCYFLGENDNSWKHAVEISKIQGLPIKILPVFSKDAAYGEFQHGAGPEEYFNLINNADVVLTDSFHGVIFSIICSKQFYVFDRFSNEDKLSQNSRVHNLLKMTHLEDRLIGHSEPVLEGYNFASSFRLAHKAIETNKKKSLEYLRASLDISSPLVSVILPAYNVEKYIADCLDSLISQTYQHLEIIIVDDGSPDNLGEIADKYAEQDKRVKVIHQKNGGRSAARNKGIDHSRGKYVVFIDPDDIVAPNFIEYLLSLVENMNASIGASYNHYNEYTDDKPVLDDRFYLLPPEEAIEGIYSWTYQLPVWNKIYRKDFIDKHKLRFLPELSYAEGMTFNVMALQHSGPVAMGLKKLYLQRYNPDSATRTPDIKGWETCQLAYDYQKKHSKIWNKQIDRAYNLHVWLNPFSILRMIYKAGDQDKYPNQIKEYKGMLRKNISSVLLADAPLKQKKHLLAIAINPEKIAAEMTAEETRRVKNNKIITAEILPWNIPKSPPPTRAEKLTALRTDNERLRAELDSILSLKRSAKLLAGNIMRRIKQGKNR